jgi:hypothetical protein
MSILHRSPLPPAARPFVAFPQLLRRHGFAAAPEQTLAFLRAIELLGPQSVWHLRRAAIATLAPPPDRQDLFNALFDAHFLGAALPADFDDLSPDAEMQTQDDGAEQEIHIGDEVNETGREATTSEALAVRRLQPPDETDALRRFERALSGALPLRRGYRRRRMRRGPGVDLARSLRAALRNDGEVLALRRWRRASRPRPVLLLIDISGSMKQRSDANLAFAHVVVQAAPRVEIFTFGTRLTRLTTALRRKNRDQALADAAALVADLDGGTRIGDALQAFLAVPRYAAYARGAAVAIISDGLERGDPEAMVDAVGRLAARAWRIDWLSPLAAAADYAPQTAALAAIRPIVASIADGGDTAALCRHLLSLGGRRAA